MGEAMTEKESHPETEDGQPQSTLEDPNRPAEFKEDGPQFRVNGGVQAWLSVLGLFCIFVNSW